MSKKKTDEASEVSFEKALARLETIVEEMESGKLSLEDMMARFEEGQKLAKLCATKLNQVERRIEILIKEGDAVTTEKFEETDDLPAGRVEKQDDGLPF